MANNRNKWEGLRWLRSLEGEPADGRITVTNVPRYTVLNAISMLGERWGVEVTIGSVNGTYTVVCVPNRARSLAGAMRVGVSYTGTSLVNILTAAVNDYAALEDRPMAAQLQSREVVRLVVP
jgi:hypothetical protein